MARATPRFWAVTAATVFTMAVTASLGLWQLDRAAQKLALQAQINDRGALAAWTNPDLLGAADATTGVHRPVRLSGQWVPQASVFLDNRQMNGRVGLYLVTPLRLDGSGRAVLGAARFHRPRPPAGHRHAGGHGPCRRPIGLVAQQAIRAG
jgi:surfeit locus 1 family protein